MTPLARQMTVAAVLVTVLAALGSSPAQAADSSRVPKSTSFSRLFPRPAASLLAPGTTVDARVSRQVIVADYVGGTRGSHWGYLRRYEWRGALRGWVQVGRPGTTVRFGKNGLQDGRTRVMGSGTTPVGVYRLPFAFGVGAPQGTRYPYQVVTPCSWWMGLEGLATGEFNRWKESCGASYPESEHLQDYVATGQYVQAVVIGHNYDDPRVSSGPGSSSAIFVHYSSPGSYTAGCVGVTDLAELSDTVAWLDPSANPVIAITF
ncbi:MAG TPA: hypothetical protein P5181_09015 [Dermatophilaceae bacterium]|nr:hypothetical protein [Dermatophilaceae bacterium]